MIPFSFYDYVLEPGDHEADSWDEIERKLGKSPERKELLVGLKKILIHLKEAGCKKVILNGSFVTMKERPRDFDLCWEIEDVEEDLLDPILLDVYMQREEIKKKYQGDIYPSTALGSVNPMRVIEDFFRINKGSDGAKKKGLIVIHLQQFPGL